jgi:hypothetical protein
VLPGRPSTFHSRFGKLCARDMVAATAQTQTPSQSLVEASFVPARAEGGPAARRRVRALVYACREAMVNAARHSERAG